MSKLEVCTRATEPVEIDNSSRFFWTLKLKYCLQWTLNVNFHSTLVQLSCDHCSTNSSMERYCYLSILSWTLFLILNFSLIFIIYKKLSLSMLVIVLLTTFAFCSTHCENKQKRERYTQMNADFPRTAKGEIRGAFFNEQCEEIERPFQENWR